MRRGYLHRKPKLTFLYRLYDEEDRLLYVGISWSYLERISKHKNKFKWYEKVRKITLEKYKNRQIAMAQEKIIIDIENPLFNLKKNFQQEQQNA